MKNLSLWKRTLVLLLALILLPLWHDRAFGEEGGVLDEERLDKWMDGYVAEHGLNASYQRFSVGFCYTGTGECWYYDADQWMYSASLYKVPVAMLMAEKEAAGELSQNTNVLGMPLQYWESTALTNSNNDSGHAMVTYLGGTYLGKCSDMTIRFTELPEDYFDQDFYVNSYYTARYMTQVMKTLYEGGGEQFPHVIEYLLPAQPDNYLNLSLKGRFDVAQKYGSYEEPNGNKNDHIAAIVYTPTPIIVTVMTRNVGNYQDRMAEIGSYLADYALELDAEIARRAEEEAERLRQEEEARRAEEEAQEAPAAETEAPQSVKETAKPAPTAAPEVEKSDSRPLRLLIPALAAVLALVLIAALLVSARRRAKARKRREAARKRARREAEQSDRYAPRH